MRPLLLLSILLTFWLTSCGGKSSNEPTPIITTNVYVTELSLPEGTWDGLGQGKDSNGNVYTIQEQLDIKDNVMVEDFSSGGYHGIAVNKFRYIAKGKSEWLDPNDKVIGQCECQSSACDCSASTGGLQVQRKFSFSKIGMSMDDNGTLGGVTYEQHYKLKKIK